jgi:hypothetical protein
MHGTSAFRATQGNGARSCSPSDAGLLVPGTISTLPNAGAPTQHPHITRQAACAPEPDADRSSRAAQPTPRAPANGRGCLRGSQVPQPTQASQTKALPPRSCNLAAHFSTAMAIIRAARLHKRGGLELRKFKTPLVRAEPGPSPSPPAWARPWPGPRRPAARRSPPRRSAGLRGAGAQRAASGRRREQAPAMEPHAVASLHRCQPAPGAGSGCRPACRRCSGPARQSPQQRARPPTKGAAPGEAEDGGQAGGLHLAVQEVSQVGRQRGQHVRAGAAQGHGAGLHVHLRAGVRGG